MARAKLSKGLKQQVYDLSGECEYCRLQRQFADSFEVEHIIPVSRGGLDTLDNLALACRQCNSLKSNKVSAIDPTSRQTVPLFHPRKMEWADHFLWSDDALEMLGITAIGRATIDLLQTNRASMVNLRRVLHQQGFHPPN